MSNGLVLLLLVGALAVAAVPWIFHPRPGPGSEQGTLLVTGVSPRPDGEGPQYVTIVGLLHGPTVDEHEVYQQIAVESGAAPAIGDLLPVTYSPKNPDNFALRRSS